MTGPRHSRPGWWTRDRAEDIALVVWAVLVLVALLWLLWLGTR